MAKFEIHVRDEEKDVPLIIEADDVTRNDAWVVIHEHDADIAIPAIRVRKVVRRRG